MPGDDQYSWWLRPSKNNERHGGIFFSTTTATALWTATALHHQMVVASILVRPIPLKGIFLCGIPHSTVNKYLHDFSYSYPVCVWMDTTPVSSTSDGVAEELTNPRQPYISQKKKSVDHNNSG